MRADPARPNNFDLLRLLFAVTVVLWHAEALSRSPDLGALDRLLSADMAVRAFFVVSGYLVVMSCETSSSLGSYARKRVRRIYPAYAAVVLLAAGAGAALSSLPVGGYLRGGTLPYLAANLSFLNFLAPTLPGVFVSNPWHAVNGALWTLKIEVMFYTFVPVLVWGYRKLGKGNVLVAVYALSVLYRGALGWAHARSGAHLWLELQRQLPGQLAYFVAGAALYLYRDRAERHWPALCALAVAAYLAYALPDSPVLRMMLEPLALGIVVVYAAYGLPYLGNFARFGDLSYGIYIIHFPVIQALIALGIYAGNGVAALAMTLALTAVLAYLSWHLVEKPFLARRSHYRLAEGR